MNWLPYRIYRSVSSLRYWAARRFTPAGWLVIVGILLCGGMATDTEQSLGYQAFAFLVCLLLLAMLLASGFRLRFAAERALPKFGTAGEPLNYQIAIRNLGTKAQRDMVLFDDLADPRPSLTEFLAVTKSRKGNKSFKLSRSAPSLRRAIVKPKAVPQILPRGEAEVELELIPLRRGVLHFSSVSLARTDPFGLFRTFSTIPFNGSVTILPKRYPLPQITLPGVARYQQGGVAFASSIGESEEFISLREYRSGDPLRHIHWRSWAKAGRPVVKEFQDEFFVRHALILDTFADANDVECFEEAVSIAASFACTIDTQESLLDLLFVGAQAFCFTAGRGVAHEDQMLEILASVEICRDKAFSALNQIVVEHATEISGAICIFLGWDDARQELVRRLKALGVPVLVMVLSKPGSRPLEPGAMNDAPDSLHVLESGNVAAGLAKL